MADFCCCETIKLPNAEEEKMSRILDVYAIFRLNLTVYMGFLRGKGWKYFEDYFRYDVED